MAKLKAEEWKANHPEFLQQRVQDIHKWQNEHPDEMLEIRRNNVKKATAKRKSQWYVLKQEFCMKAQVMQQDRM